MAILNFPDIDPTDILLWRLHSLSYGYRSPLSGWTQDEEVPGGTFWRCRMRFKVHGDERYALESWIHRMRGTTGRVYYGDPDFLIMGPRGLGSGVATAQGAGQSGSVLQIDTPDLNVVDWAKQGDYVAWDVGVRRQLHRIIADADSNALGEVTLNIEPPIARAPGDGQALIFEGATCVMKFIDDKQGEGSVNKTGWFLTTFELEQVAL